MIFPVPVYNPERIPYKIPNDELFLLGRGCGKTWTGFVYFCNSLGYDVIWIDEEEDENFSDGKEQ